MKCEKCELDHAGTFGSGRFCSRKCSNSRGPRTDDFKQKVSSKLLGRPGHSSNLGKELVPRETRTCTKCAKEFRTLITSKKKLCSNKCGGGYREGSGRAKTGYYKGIYCGSTYELVWVIYMLDHNLPFERFNGSLTREGVTYFPDFVVGKNIYEMKGFESIESVDKKTKVAQSFGYEVNVLYKNDLFEHFDWVKKNYTYNKIYELYDDYKPKYEYSCVVCNKPVNRNTRSKTDTVCCSRKCSGIKLVKKN